MKANNLTISVPTDECHYKCPYCVSNMTYPIVVNYGRWEANLPKLRALAERVGVTHILVTGKGELTTTSYFIDYILKEFNFFPKEIQTKFNTKTLCDKVNRDQTVLDLLRYFDVVSFSVDNPTDLEQRKWKLIKKESSYIKRLAIILSNRFNNKDLRWFINKCKELEIEQLTIRMPTVPERIIGSEKSRKTVKWIRENTDRYQWDQLVFQLKDMVNYGKAKFVRDLLFGAAVYDIFGIGFTLMEYCVESQNGEFMRSLIYQADGHLYTTWDQRGSIIF